MFGLSIKGMYIATAGTYLAGIFLGAWYPLASVITLLASFVVARFLIPGGASE